MRTFSITVGDSSIELPPGDTIIGRGLACRLRLADLRVSRQHLRIQVGSEGATVEDLGSANGTLLNGRQLVAPTVLEDGDVLELGGSTKLGFLVQEDDGSVARRGTIDVADTLVGAASELARVATQAIEVNQLHEISTDTETADRSSGGQKARPERRRHARQRAKVPVSYDSATLNVDAIARDVSDGGIFVVSELLDQVGTPCEMTIQLEGLRPMRARGIVRHVVVSDAAAPDPPGMGIQFTELMKSAASAQRS